MRLDGPDHAGGQLLRRKAVEQQADVDDVVHVPPHVDVRRADQVGIDQLVLRQIVVKACGRFVDGCARPEREIRREARRLNSRFIKADNKPSVLIIFSKHSFPDAVHLLCPPVLPLPGKFLHHTALSFW